MALKALVQIREFDYDPSGGMSFTIKIFCLSPVANLIDRVNTGFTNTMPSDAASVINAAVASFTKDYCTTTWGTVWDVLDTVRILAAVDSIL